MVSAWMTEIEVPRTLYNLLEEIARRQSKSVAILAAEMLAAQMKAETNARKEAEGKVEWIEAKSRRRSYLINKEIENSLSPGEEDELEELHRQMLAYHGNVAPLPREESKELLDRLLGDVANEDLRAAYPETLPDLNDRPDTDSK